MDRREFELIDGSSRKFWAIEVDGAQHTVHYGRIGTDGQRKTKEFASEREASDSAAKLIAQKTRKGYAEVGAGAAPSAAPVRERAPAAPAAPDPATPARAAPEASPRVAPAVAAADPTVRRSIALEPLDWAWATWRFTEPLERGEPAPFDRAACLRRLARVRTKDYGWGWRWELADLAPVLERAEALFWLRAMSLVDGPRKTPKEVAAAMASGADPDDLELADVPKRLRRNGRFIAPEVMLCLSSLFPADALIDQVVGMEGYGEGWQRSQFLDALVDGIRRYLVPYLGAAEREALRDRLRPRLDPDRLSVDLYDAHPAAFYVAAQIGMRDELLAATRSWPDETYSAGEEWNDHYHRPQLLVFGLEDPALVESEMRRLGLRLNLPEYVRAWLAHTEHAALDYAAEGALAITNRDDCAALVNTLALVDAPENAGPMLRLRSESKAPSIARDWLNEHLANAIVGLAPVACGSGKLAGAALEFLRQKRREGHGATMAQLLPALEPAVADRIRQAVLEREEVVHEPFDEQSTPDWLAAGVADAPRAKLPVFANAGTLPPLVVGDRSLAPAQVGAVLATLTACPPGEPAPLLVDLRRHAVPDSADSFAWALFEAWLEDGAPSKQKWALGAIGHLGGDQAALKLTPLVRAWPGESQHQRAVFALDCLRAIGSDTALMQLSGIAQKLKFKGLKARAQACMEAIAKDKGMTRPELEDRIVPDCDLDENGTRVLDFGPRRFFVALGPGMKPTVRDESGKLLRDLPKPGKKDDEALAGAAVSAWKLTKKQLREVTKLQAVRLEQSMVTGRRWPVGDFETLLVRHPLMTNLVRLLLWGGYDASGELVDTFRVTDERDYADRADEAAVLDTYAEVGIVHPLELDEATANAWGEVLSDYAIVPPFSQLGRPTYGLEPGEAERTCIARFGDVKIPATALVGTLERLGWVRGIPEDAGIFYEHSKPFYGAGVTAVVQYEDGVPVGYMEGWDDQRVTGCFFVPGIYSPEMYPRHDQSVPLSSVHGVVLSETLADLHELAGKGS